MKQLINGIFTLSVGLLALASCSDNDYMETNKGMDELTLTTSVAATELSEANHGSEAVTFDWTTGNNYGTGNRIYYTLELAPAGTGFANAHYAVDYETQVYEWSCTQENLNNILIDKFGATPGTPFGIDARLTAKVAGYEEVQTATATLEFTPYKAVTSTLYMIGSAAPNGWSADNATELTRTDNGLFSWEGSLAQGEIKFITTLGQFLPSYNNDGNGGLTYRTSDDQADEKFVIPEAHYYKVEVNLLENTATFTPTDGAVPRFEQIWFVGNPTGWSFVEMTRDALDPYLFRYGAYFAEGSGGEFKFGTANGSWENMYESTFDHAPYTSEDVKLNPSFDDDWKWYLEDSELNQAYKICLDIRDGAERMLMKPFTPYEMIYLVGDATPNGWSIDAATPMEKGTDDYTFTWTGKLNSGELKFTCDRQSDWNGAWFLCGNGNDIEPTGDVERMLFIDKSSDDCKNQYLDNAIGDVDQKWQITSAGTYTITLNQLLETVSIVKQ